MDIKNTVMTFSGNESHAYIINSEFLDLTVMNSVNIFKEFLPS